MRSVQQDLFELVPPKVLTTLEQAITDAGGAEAEHGVARLQAAKSLPPLRTQSDGGPYAEYRDERGGNKFLYNQSDGTICLVDIVQHGMRKDCECCD